MSNKNRTEFDLLREWLMARPRFRFGDVSNRFGDYPSSAHTYLNSLLREHVVRRVSRGLYEVANKRRLLGITTGDLRAHRNERMLRRKLRDFELSTNRLEQQLSLARAGGYAPKPAEVISARRHDADTEVSNGKQL